MFKVTKKDEKEKGKKNTKRNENKKTERKRQSSNIDDLMKNFRTETIPILVVVVTMMMVQFE